MQIHRNCPICDGTSRRVLYSQKRIQLDGSFFPDENDIVACAGCGFVYVDSELTQERCDAHYRRYASYDNADISTSSTDEPTDSERKRFRFGLEEVCGMFEKQAAILDVGCASGAFLQLLVERGFTNLHGMDMSPDCVRRMREKGMSAYPGSITESINIRARFDCVTLFQSLEHVHDLKTAVRNLRTLLRDGGRLLVDVPDAARYPEMFSKTWFYQEHVNHFDAHALVNLFAGPFRPLKTWFASASDGILHAKIPTVGVVFEAVAPVADVVVEPGAGIVVRNNRTCERNVARYITLLKDAFRPAENLFRELAQTQEEIAVWGAGFFFTELLALTPLRECNIVRLVDRDVHKHGREVRGLRVAPPESLYDYSGSILVASEESKGSILRNIVDMKPGNKIYTV